MSKGAIYLTIIFLALCLLAIRYGLKTKRPNRPANFPPIVRITKEEMFGDDPITAYTNAIRKHGGVIAVEKKGKMEVVVDETHAHRVLTDSKNFSFEEGVADAMNFQFLLSATEGQIFHIMAEVTTALFAHRMDTVVRQVSWIFFTRAESLSATSSYKDSGIDLFEHCQSTVSDAMVVLLLGERFLTRANSDRVKLAANDVAELGGIFSNRSYYARNFPALWRFTTFLRMAVIRFGFGLFLFLGRPIWSEMSRLVQDPQTYDEKMVKDPTLLLLLVRRFAGSKRWLTLGERGQIYLILISTMFASVHQVASTMVWVLCELALRPDDQQSAFDEIQRLMPDGPSGLKDEDLKAAAFTDSFIRETMRTKGDMLSTVRMAMNDVRLGGYVVPKGYTVHPSAALAHMDPTQAGEDPEVFKSRRWMNTDKVAAMPGRGHLAWGLGRFACPGRVWAVNEIKMMIFSILSKYRVELVGGKYEVVDKLMVASAPPEAGFVLTRRSESSANVAKEG